MLSASENKQKCLEYLPVECHLSLNCNIFCCKASDFRPVRICRKKQRCVELRERVVAGHELVGVRGRLDAGAVKSMPFCCLAVPLC